MQSVAAEMNVPFLGTVPLDPAIVVSGDAGVPTVVSEPDSPAAEAFRQRRFHEWVKARALALLQPDQRSLKHIAS